MTDLTVKEMDDNIAAIVDLACKELRPDQQEYLRKKLAEYKWQQTPPLDRSGEHE